MDWPWKRKTLVLGSELAAALKREEERLSLGIAGISPLLNFTYDFERGDYDLVAVSILGIDKDIRDFTNNFHKLDLVQRQRVLQNLSLDDLYTLIHFVKRAAVFALNGDSLEWCRAGLVALSMIDETRVDWRDQRWCAGILSHSIWECANVVRKLNEEIEDTSRRTGALPLSVPPRSQLSDWSYAEVKTSYGKGLIASGRGRYAPTLNLTEIALKIANRITMGRYVCSVEIAADVPDVWFEVNLRADARLRLNNSNGCASIHGNLREAFSHKNQILFAWLVEMPTEKDCEKLVADVGSGTNQTEKYSLGIAAKRLFALIVAGSAQIGVESFETQESLAEIAEEFLAEMN